MAVAFGVITVVYIGLAAATIAVTSGTTSKVPLADLMAVGLGRAGRDATAVLAVALTMGTMNVYMGGSAKLAAALAQEGALPRWLAGDAHRSIPRRPLLVLAFTGTLVLLALGAGFSNAADLVRATSACFVVVYLASLASAVRILGGRIRVSAIVSLALVAVVALFSELFLLVPLGAALVALGARRVSRRRARERAQPHPA
jgi:amino acid transporter